MTTLYEKVGRRYIPVKESDDKMFWAMPEGAHLVITKLGSTSIKYRVDPDNAAVLTSIRLHRDDLAEIIRKASQLRPSKLTKREIKAVQAYKDVAGEQALMILNIPGAYDIVDALEEAIVGLTNGRP